MCKLPFHIVQVHSPKPLNAQLRIGSRNLGPGNPVYIVAELSANHNQDLQRAVSLIDAATDAGADAIKLQTYTPDTITIRSDREPFQIRGGTLWDGRTLHDLYAEAFTPWDCWRLVQWNSESADRSFVIA